MIGQDQHRHLDIYISITHIYPIITSGSYQGIQQNFVRVLPKLENNILAVFSCLVGSDAFSYSMKISKTT
jgi:hypothetical protein